MEFRLITATCSLLAKNNIVGVTFDRNGTSNCNLDKLTVTRMMSQLTVTWAASQLTVTLAILQLL